MIVQRKSLLGTLVKNLAIPFAVAFLLGGYLVYSVVTEEYDELQDAGLISKAQLMLKVFESYSDASEPVSALDASTLLSFEEATHDRDERTLFWFLNADGDVLAQSPLAQASLMQPSAHEGLSTMNDHRVALQTSSTGSGIAVVVAEPMRERNEAIRGVVLGLLSSFLLLGAIFVIAVFWSVRRAVDIVADLSDDIAQKNQFNLTSIDRRSSFAEIEPAIDTLDELMERLDTALAAERAFATNAAHELRTPIAISLAQVQRLKSKLDDPDISGNVAEIETALKRLVRLIERLLEMSRAQSGLGSSAIKTDINQVTRLLLNELRTREPSEEKLIVKHPSGEWLSHVDPDAFGIILSNLFDNMLKHASGGAPSVVDATQSGRVTISNDCDPLDAADVEEIKGRFVRKTTMPNGYGLGLSIVQELCNQSGCTLEVVSPQQGRTRGYTATLTVPSR